MVLVTFNGNVSKQAQAGSPVTIEVFVAGQTEPYDTATASTDELGNFTTNLEVLAGDYNAKAIVPEDSIYLQAESALVPFTIVKLPRTITLNVVVP